MNYTNPDQYYLNDDVINDYHKLISERDPSVYCYDSYFYTKLKTWGIDSLQRWTRKVNIFSKRLLLVPININLPRFKHWILVCVNIEKKTITRYNSLKCINYSCEGLENIAKYLCKEHFDKLGTNLCMNDWKLEIGENPQQKNGVDCGVFVCTFSEYLSRNAIFNFDQSHMLSFRQLILYELTIQELINVDVPTAEISQFINNVLRH